MQYQDRNDICYLDILDNKIFFEVAPATGLTVRIDYIHTPADLTLTTSPIFPSRFHNIIVHGMASDNYMIQQTNKNDSYAKENDGKYNDILSNMALWNARLSNN
jgi:hypothetical protein